MISHKRKRWRPQPEALLADKGCDTDRFINSLEVRAIKAATRYEKTRAQLSLAGCIWSAHSLGSNDERP